MQSKLISDTEPPCRSCSSLNHFITSDHGSFNFLTCYDFSYRQSKSTHGYQDAVSLGRVPADYSKDRNLHLHWLLDHEVECNTILLNRRTTCPDTPSCPRRLGSSVKSLRPSKSRKRKRVSENWGDMCSFLWRIPRHITYSTRSPTIHSIFNVKTRN
jgi:hypothetical protein